MAENKLAIEVLKQMKEQHSTITKRLITALIIVVILFIGTNIYWVYKSYQPTDTEIYDVRSKDK